MKRIMTVLLLVSIGTLGCVAVPAKRTPKLDKPRRAPEIQQPPAIRLVVNDETHRSEKNAQSLDRVLDKFPYLSAHSMHTSDPDYTIELSVDYGYTESDVNFFAYYTLMMIPAIYTDEVTVRARVTGADGRSLGTVSSTGRLKQVAQLHLIVTLPITGPLYAHANGKMWRRSFRDALIQASRLIEEDHRVMQSAGAVTSERTPSS